jgi:hypothetical protein
VSQGSQAATQSTVESAYVLTYRRQESEGNSVWLTVIEPNSDERVAVYVPVVHPMDSTTLTRTEVYEKYADQLVRFATGIDGPTRRVNNNA